VCLSKREETEMFTTFKTSTLAGKIRFQILDFGYRTNNHPSFGTEEKAKAYIKKAEQDQVKVSRAKAIKAEADAYRATL
jgi:hypothetical protein